MRAKERAYWYLNSVSFGVTSARHMTFGSAYSTSGLFRNAATVSSTEAEPSIRTT